MASHKNQHFVPRCYLRPFTLNGDGLAVNLYNIDKQLSIRNVPVKGQCARNYFYGKDLRLEKLLQKSESLYADAVRKIDKHSCMADIAFGGNVPTDLRTSVKDAVQMTMKAFSDTAHVINDLKVVLIRNRTDRSFITSDDPAVLTNRWHIQTPIAQHESFGIGSSGALFFLPITPKIFWVIYDGGVYSMPHDNGWIDIYKRSDVDLFNQHQVFNCAANIYFRDWSDAAEVDQLYRVVAHLRPSVRHELIVSVLEHEDDWEKNIVSLVGMSLGATRKYWFI